MAAGPSVLVGEPGPQVVRWCEDSLGELEERAWFREVERPHGGAAQDAFPEREEACQPATLPGPFGARSCECRWGVLDGG